MTEQFVSGAPQKPLRVSTFAGGAGLRAANVVRMMDADTLAVGFAGGRVGELLGDALDRQDVPHVLTRTASETRGAFLLLDKETGVVTLIPENVPATTDSENAKLLQSLSRHIGGANYLLVSGDDSESGLLASALGEAKSTQVRTVADVKGLSLEAALQLGDLFLLRVSHKSLQRHLSRSLSHDSAIVREANALRETHRVQNIVVTLGEDGALLVGESGATRVKAPVVSHFNPTGGGQTLVGAMLARLQAGDDLTDALRWGCAAASVNVTHDEPGYATVAETQILLAKTTAVPVQTR